MTELAHAEQLLDREPAEAARRVAAVLCDDPANVGALCLMARARLALGRPDLAYEAVSAAVTCNRDSSYVRYLLSDVLSQLGRHDEAIVQAYESVKLDPRNAYRHDRVTWALLGADTRGDEAEEAARTAVELAPEDPEFRISYARVMSRRGRTGEARRALLHALLLDPPNAAARHELAALQTAGGRGPARPAGGLLSRFTVAPGTRSGVPYALRTVGLALIAVVLLVAGMPMLLLGLAAGFAAQAVAGALLVVVGGWAGYLIARRAGGFT